MRSITAIKKRDGRVVPFEPSKISAAIRKALVATSTKDGKRAKALAKRVVAVLERRFAGRVPTVEGVQDIVEETLMRNGLAGAAKAYILYRQKKAEEREAKRLLGVRDELKLSINAMRVLERRYLLRDDERQIAEMPAQLFRRVAKALAAADEDATKSEDEFYRMMVRLDFMPNTPCLMNAGARLGQLAACYVVDMQDTLESILDALRLTAMLQQGAAGTGFNFSHLRPRGDVISSTKGTTPGPVTFIKLFDMLTDVMKQGGCISTKSLVRTTNGVLPIGKLLECPTFGDNPTRHLVYTNGGFEHAFIAEDNNIAEVYNIKTKIGTGVKVTPDHQICVIDTEGRFSWKEAEKLQRDDWVVHVLGGHCGEDVELPKLERAQHYNANPIRVLERMSPALAELLGIYMADGCISTNGRIVFAVEEKDVELKKRITALMSNIFGLNLGVEQRKPNDNSVCLVFYSRDLCKFFDRVGCKKESALDAFVPSVIFESKAESARSFIRGLFEGDGDVHTDGYPRLYSSSERLISGVQQLLFGLSMVSTIHKYYSENRYGKNPIYHLCIVQEGSVKEFIKNVGFISQRKNEKLLERQKNKAFESFDIMPNQEGLLRKLYNGPGRGCGKGRSKRGANRRLYRELQHFLDTTSSKRNLTRKKLKELLNKFDELRHEQLLKIVDNGYFYSQVTTITKEKDYTMDIAVPISEQFVANSILVHNKRRGANMGILNAEHPDILEFITAKSDMRSLGNFNISVAVTDAFMKKAERGGEYELVNPRTKKAVRSINAADVFSLIVTNAWLTGDPGLVFIDEINRRNPTPLAGRIESTNPCVTGSARLATEHGLLTMQELYDTQAAVSVVTDNRVPVIRPGRGMLMLEAQKTVGVTLHSAVPVFKTRFNAPVFRLRTEHGYEITATAEHKFYTPEGRRELKKLGTGDEILLQSGGAWSDEYALPVFAPRNKFLARLKRGECVLPASWSAELGEVLGWLIGDGFVSADTPRGRHVPNYIVGFVFGNEEKKALMPRFRALIKEWTGLDGSVMKSNGGVQLRYKSALYYLLQTLGFSAQKHVPEAIWRAPREAALGFLRGLFTADGTVNASTGRCSIRLSSSMRELLQDVQLLLLNEGIVSHLRQRRKAGAKMMPDSQRRAKLYQYAPQFELILDKINRDVFVKQIGFMTEAKQTRAESWITAKKRKSNSERFITRIASIEHAGTEDVYCTTEPETHSIAVNGFVTAQCGEVPLLPYENCMLGSINLSNFVKNGEIDYGRLRGTVRSAVRFLDNAITVNKYTDARFRDMAMANRKIGLGVMGFADALVQMGVPYDSNEAVRIAEQLAQFIEQEGHGMSQELAAERGNFKNFGGSIWQKKGYGCMRNATVTTIAPTGTISVITDCSSGIEPLFAVVFVRNVMEGTKLLETNRHFERVARERGFYSRELMADIAKSGSVQGMRKVPKDVQRVFVTALDIAPEWHVRMQATFQKHVDNAVSKTINFPANATVEDVRKAYLLAWKLKCKGITIYRYGSKPEQVLYTGPIASAEMQVAQREFASADVEYSGGCPYPGCAV